MKGRVIHELNRGETVYLSVFSWDKEDAEVVAVDGLFFAVRRSLFHRIRFDDATFDGFHFYDLDLCMQIRKTHRLIVTWDLLVKHLSAGRCDDSWKEAGARFLKKYAGQDVGEEDIEMVLNDQDGLMEFALLIEEALETNTKKPV